MKVPVRSSRPQRLLFYSSLLALLVCINASAQVETKIDGGNGGRNTLQGDILMPGGQRLDHPVMVRLSTPRGELNTTSNGNGSFVFRQLTAGRYTVMIDAGDTFAQAIEVVEIAESGAGGALSRIGQIYTVQVHLRPSAGAPIVRGVISANDPPKPALDLYNQALESVKEGKRDLAIQQLKGAISIHPTFVAALNGLGVQYLKLGNFQAAYEALNAALTISPDNFMLHLNCGIALLNLKKPAEAEAEFSAALLKNEASGSAHLYRARALISLKRLDEAAKNLKRAVEIGGEDVKIAHRYLAGIHMEKGENLDAVRELELYLKASPETKEADQIKNLIKELSKKAAG